MFRRLFNLVTFMSLLLGVAGAVCWAASYRTDGVTFNSSGYQVWFHDGHGHFNNAPGYIRRILDDARREARHGAMGPPVKAIENANVSELFLYRTPLGAVMMVCAFAPVSWLYILVRGQRRCATSGLCADCGYDLRATPDRCPECGSSIPGLNRNRCSPSGRNPHLILPPAPAGPPPRTSGASP